MESITLFVSIVIAVFGILQIILFFKIWGMTNDVAELNRIIKEHLSKQVNSNTFISAIGDNLPMLADEIHHQTGNLKKDDCEIKHSGRWGKDVTATEKDKAYNLIPKLQEGQIIIKIEDCDDLTVCDTDGLADFSSKKYEVIYY